MHGPNCVGAHSPRTDREREVEEDLNLQDLATRCSDSEPAGISSACQSPPGSELALEDKDDVGSRLGILKGVA